MQQRERVLAAAAGMVEGLEDRRLLSASLVSGTLLVGGSPGGDTISVSVNSQRPALLNVSVNGKVSSFRTSSVHKIRVNASGGSDRVVLGTSVTAPSLLLGGSGNDTLGGGSGRDYVGGGTGRDQLRGRLGDDTLAGASGDDSLRGDAGDDSLQGGAGDDSLDGSYGDDSLDGGDDDDLLYGGSGSDDLDGDSGEDRLDGGLDDDVLNGGDGDDSLEGGGGDDSLDGEDVDGLVVSVDGGSITLAGEAGGADRVFTLSPAVVVTLDHAPGTLGDISPGAEVELDLSPDGTQVIAIDVEDSGDDD